MIDCPLKLKINNWNVSKVYSMYSMFVNAHSFNQPLNKWNVVGSRNAVLYDVYVPNAIMWDIFDGASSFDQRRHAPWYVPTEEE